MPATASKRKAPAERKRRMHAKSRKGCENCKLRRVKCDETYPRCAKCKSYGVACNYGGSKASLDSSAQGCFQVELRSSTPQEQIMSFESATAPTTRPPKHRGLNAAGVSEIWKRDIKIQPFNGVPCHWASRSLGRPWSPVSTNATAATMIGDSLRAGALGLDSRLGTGSTTWSNAAYFEFSQAHLEILTRFQKRTSITVGDRRMTPVYGDIVCQLATQHTFLMHMLIALTLMHDCELSSKHSPKLAAKQNFVSLQHWNIATQLFHRIISGELSPPYRDAIWATGVQMVAASFWYMESGNVEEVYPLKPGEVCDLSWLKISAGERDLWGIVDPSRPDSAFESVVKRDITKDLPEWMTSNDTSKIPERLKQAFGVTPESTAANNVYHLPILILSRFQDMRQAHPESSNHLYVCGFVPPHFFALLEVKEPRAVFVLGWWFNLIVDRGLWWMTRRARTEGEAIRIWLKRNHSELGELFDLLVEGHLGTEVSGRVDRLSAAQV